MTIPNVVDELLAAAHSLAAESERLEAENKKLWGIYPAVNLYLDGAQNSRANLTHALAQLDGGKG